MIKTKLKAVILGFVLFALFGCGVKGDPVPYVESNPEPPKSQKGS